MSMELLLAARTRMLEGGRTTLHGAFLDLQDGDPMVQILEETTDEQKGVEVKPALDAIEIRIAVRVDDGFALPVPSDKWDTIQWLATGDLADLPDPIPREDVLYLAKAFADADDYPDMETALNTILTTRTFS